MNTYRKEYINTLLKRQHKLRKDIKELLGIRNNTVLREVCDGGDIYISRLVQIADFFGVSCAEFFEFNGQTVDGSNTMPSSDALTQHLVRQIVESEMAARRAIKESDEQIRQMEKESMQQLQQQQLEYEREMSRLREELVRIKEQLKLSKNGSENIKTIQQTPYPVESETHGLLAAEDGNTERT